MLYSGAGHSVSGADGALHYCGMKQYELISFQDEDFLEFKNNSMFLMSIGAINVTGVISNELLNKIIDIRFPEA